MIDLDIPDFLRISQDERRQSWKGRKLTKPKAFITTKPVITDPGTKRLMRELEQQAKAKKAASLQRLKEWKERQR